MGKAGKCSECKPLATVKVLERIESCLKLSLLLGDFGVIYKTSKDIFAKDRVILTRSSLTCCACRGVIIVCTTNPQLQAFMHNWESVPWRFLLWLNWYLKNTVASRMYVENQAPNSIISCAFKLCLAKIFTGCQPPHRVPLLNKWNNPVLASHYFGHFVCFRAFKLSTFSWGPQWEISWW